jgi:hypothetical protein
MAAKNLYVVIALLAISTSGTAPRPAAAYKWAFGNGGMFLQVV